MEGMHLAQKIAYDCFCKEQNLHAQVQYHIPLLICSKEAVFYTIAHRSHAPSELLVSIALLIILRSGSMQSLPPKPLWTFQSSAAERLLLLFQELSPLNWPLPCAYRFIEFSELTYAVKETRPYDLSELSVAVLFAPLCSCS